MRSLQERGLVDPLNEAVLDHRIPVLGICLGMQLMTRSSEEGGSHGLGWVNADTRRIVPADRTRFKVPHVGWSTVNGNPECSLLYILTIPSFSMHRPPTRLPLCAQELSASQPRFAAVTSWDCSSTLRRVRLPASSYYRG